MRTSAGWLINGTKRFITGADGADFFIVMARTSTPDDPVKATMFLVPAETPGARVGKHLRTQDVSMVGGHCEMTFENVEMADSDILGEAHEGFRNAQVRLAPARMTHVMRWLAPPGVPTRRR